MTGTGIEERPETPRPGRVERRRAYHFLLDGQARDEPLAPPLHPGYGADRVRPGDSQE